MIQHYSNTKAAQSTSGDPIWINKYYCSVFINNGILQMSEEIFEVVFNNFNVKLHVNLNDDTMMKFLKDARQIDDIIMEIHNKQGYIIHQTKFKVKEYLGFSYSMKWDNSKKINEIAHLILEYNCSTFNFRI